MKKIILSLALLFVQSSFSQIEVEDNGYAPGIYQNGKLVGFVFTCSIESGRKCLLPRDLRFYSQDKSVSYVEHFCLFEKFNYLSGSHRDADHLFLENDQKFEVNSVRSFQNECAKFPGATYAKSVVSEKTL